MVNLVNSEINFQINKVNRLIRLYGQNFIFKRQKLNEYNEPIKDDEEQIEVFGVYHETNSIITQTSSEAAVLRSKVQPLIMCMNDEAEKIKKNDLLEIKGTKYKVVDKIDLNKMGICVDVSLEVIQDG